MAHWNRSLCIAFCSCIIKHNRKCSHRNHSKLDAMMCLPHLPHQSFQYLRKQRTWVQDGLGGVPQAPVWTCFPGDAKKWRRIFRKQCEGAQIGVYAHPGTRRSTLLRQASNTIVTHLVSASTATSSVRHKRVWRQL
jgi:hypothetical protein